MVQSSGFKVQDRVLRTSRAVVVQARVFGSFVDDGNTCQSHRGRYAPPIKQAEYWELMKTAAAQKKAREEAGISLRQMAERMSMDVAVLSRLENGINANPTIETLFRYARSLGKNVLV